ncbi:MAG: translation initiation factor IF-3 [Chloroflexi bacterium]|nr:translation initiation factor IF-3 [Chloroflexota bacterium]
MSQPRSTGWSPRYGTPDRCSANRASANRVNRPVFDGIALLCYITSRYRRFPDPEDKLISSKNSRINEQIRVREVRLIDVDGKQLGVVPTREALEMARAKQVDLVEVAPNAAPPVCRLLDFGKFMYERTKKEREARKAHKVQELKELRFKPTTDEYHIGFKLKQARKYLSDGSKVKVSVLFRGRSITHPEVGKRLLELVVEKLGSDAALEQPPKMEGRSLQMVLAPPPNTGKTKPAEKAAAPAKVPQASA